jgi:transcriptional regulator with XRE-family HTH domain
MEMGEVRDRGILLTTEGQAMLKEAMSARRDLDGKKWTFIKVSEASGVSEKTVSRFVNGKQSVDDSTARAIAQALEVPFERLEALMAKDPGQSDKIGMLSINPFTYGTPVSADRFYGRKEVLKFVGDRLRQGTSVNLVGLRRSGKTSLLRYLMSDRFKGSLFEPEKTIFVFLDLSTTACATPLDLTEGLRRGIEKGMGKSPWRKDENDDAWVVQEALEDVRDRGWRVVILMDEFEAIERKLDLFQEWATDWRSKASTGGLFTMVVASQRSLAEFYQSHNRTSPFDNIFNLFIIGAMEEWQDLVLDQWKLSAEGLSWVDGLAGGMPYYVQLAASMLWDAEENTGLARMNFVTEAEGRFGVLWRDLEEAERGMLRSLSDVKSQGAIGQRLVRYGVIRSDGRLFSSAFGEWIRENGGAV